MCKFLASSRNKGRTAEFLIVQQRALSARKGKPLTKYASYVYEYVRSCRKMPPPYTAESACAECLFFCVCHPQRS
jgi:hypothetical protein